MNNIQGIGTDIDLHPSFLFELTRGSLTPYVMNFDRSGFKFTLAKGLYKIGTKNLIEVPWMFQMLDGTIIEPILPSTGGKFFVKLHTGFPTRQGNRVYEVRSLNPDCEHSNVEVLIRGLKMQEAGYLKSNK